MALVEDRALAHTLDMSTVQQPIPPSPQRKPHLQHRQGSDTARVSGQESISDPQRAQPTAMETSAATPELPSRMTVYRRRPSGPTHQPEETLSGKSPPSHSPRTRRDRGNNWAKRPLFLHHSESTPSVRSNACVRQPINSLFYPPQRGGGSSL